ncbi:uncharacterized protein LOC105282674 isoform X3 [Ooceraea biroi]|uniref:uncharacterized protein LOC105282674 isoform X3 n=1 Tax=Ooceraea biroi TaxID=2015173 RepID=UPI0005B7D255|nr:uncharacterized protein LOC105282674 isoform X3 [Ooceraea biroi]
MTRGRLGIPEEAARSRYGPPRGKFEVCITVALVDWSQHVDKTVRPRLCSSSAPRAGHAKEDFHSGWCAVVRRCVVRVRSRMTCARGHEERDTVGQFSASIASIANVRRGPSSSYLGRRTPIIRSTANRKNGTRNHCQ